MSKLEFFDPEDVHRPTPNKNWRALGLAALAATAALTAGWEIFWRGKGMTAGDFKNTEALWAEARRKATGEATVIIGSSRIFFGIDLDVWEEASGVRPVQLAFEGTSPRIFLKDLADDENFAGQVIVGVTVPLFFATDGGLRASVLKYAKNETLSQRADHFLSKQIEKHLAFIDEQSRPKRQVQIWPLPMRDGMKPLFSPRKLSASTADRNTELWARVVKDEAYREEAKKQWAIGIANNTPPPGPNGAPPPPFPEEAIAAVIAEVKANVDRIRARGGDVAFLRLPYDGAYTLLEDKAFPRERFWDRLVRETDSVGIAWQDYPSLQGHHVVEWSHLAARDAENYTRAAAPLYYEAMEMKAAERAAR